MPKKIFFTRALLVVITIIIALVLIPFLSSCNLTTVNFGDLTICSEIDEETGAPLKEKDEFNLNVKKIFATIEVSGVNADDNKRFTIVNNESEQIIYDDTDKYSIKLEGMVEGNFYLETNDLEEGQILMEPGSYTVSFYHNGELKDSVGFKINQPKSEIMEVTLSSEVDIDTLEPLNTVSEFGALDTVYVAVLTNYQILGDVYSVRWYYGEEDIIDIEDIEIQENKYIPVYATFWLASDMTTGPGNYKVEVYLNNSLYGKYEFLIIGEVPVEDEETATGGEAFDYFSQGNVYMNEDYGFDIMYPDGWTVQEGVVEEGLSILFIPDSEDIHINMSISSSKEGPLDPDGLEAFSNNKVYDISVDWESEISSIEASSGEIIGYYYEEYDYILTGLDENIFSYVDFLILRENDLIVFEGAVDEYDLDLFVELFVTMLGSLYLE